MGMFDYLRCHYPLPIEGAAALEYQTKDTSAQMCDRYELRADGTLWHQAYDVEDDAFVNKRWEADLMTGRVAFYSAKANGEWVEVEAQLVDGRIESIEVISPLLTMQHDR